MPSTTTEIRARLRELGAKASHLPIKWGYDEADNVICDEGSEFGRAIGSFSWADDARLATFAANHALDLLDDLEKAEALNAELGRALDLSRRVIDESGIGNDKAELESARKVIEDIEDRGFRPRHTSRAIEEHREKFPR